jgi:hypothetical protein
MTPFQITPPAIEPVSLAEQKTWLRVDDASEDDIIAALVTSARVLVEKATRLCLITQTWRFTLDGWPHSTADRGPRWLNRVEVRLPIAPFQSAGVKLEGHASVAWQLVARTIRDKVELNDDIRIEFLHQSCRSTPSSLAV